MCRGWWKNWSRRVSYEYVCAMFASASSDKNMNAIPLAIPEVVLLEPRVFSDSRGFFFESFNQREFERTVGRSACFVQDNHSRSGKNVLRGLHYQVTRPQGKLIRVVAGEVFDVVVDLRRQSPTFGRWVGQVLSAENRKQLWIPEGFAHGFVALSEYAECLYKTTDYWVPESERCIIWNDPVLSIDWPITEQPVLSARDQQGSSFGSAEVFD